MEASLDRTELAQRSMLAEYSHPVLGHVTTVGLPIKIQGYVPAYRPAPRLDADRVAVLQAAGYDAADIDALRNRGAFGHG